MGSELLFPFIASVIVILLFRKLDRSNYRLSQIKKHSTKMNEDINRAAMAGIQAVKDTTIDLDIMGKQARKVIANQSSSHFPRRVANQIVASVLKSVQ